MNQGYPVEHKVTRVQGTDDYHRGSAWPNSDPTEQYINKLNMDYTTDIETNIQKAMKILNIE